VLRCAVMRPGPSPPWGLSLLAGVLIAIFLAQAFLTSAIKSPVFDETGDIAAGLSYVQSGEIRANLQHPPLAAGAALAKGPRHRNVMLEFWSGEELGLIGSAAYVNAPPVPN